MAARNRLARNVGRRSRFPLRRIIACGILVSKTVRNMCNDASAVLKLDMENERNLQ